MPTIKLNAGIVRGDDAFFVFTSDNKLPEVHLGVSSASKATISEAFYKKYGRKIIAFGKKYLDNQGAPVYFASLGSDKTIIAPSLKEVEVTDAMRDYEKWSKFPEIKEAFDKLGYKEELIDEIREFYAEFEKSKQ